MLFLCKWFWDSFWTDSLWFSSGIKWSDVTNEPHKNILYPDTSDFLYHIMLMVVFLSVKYIMEKYCYDALGRALGLKHKKLRKVEKIPLLEAAYRKSAIQKDVAALAKQLDMSERQVERWWRLRKNMDKPTRLIKFREHAWKATYSACNCLFGLYILWDKDYFWNLDQCYFGHPHQGVTKDVWWFYAINTGHTLSSLITMFSDTRRADFIPSIVHHVLTAALLTISWISSWYSIGIVLLPPLDGSDALLEAAKGFKSAKYEAAGRITFFAFNFVWFYVRMYIFPFHILHSTIITAPTIAPPSFVYSLLIAMLLMLFVLQVYWSVLIIKSVYNILAYGIVHDVRSSESESSDCQPLDGGANGVHNNGIRSNLRSATYAKL